VAVTREDIVRAAVAQIDEAGLAGLTLRSVAARVGVSAPTLYWHVRDKRHLLDLVSEHVVGGFLPGELERPAAGEPVARWLGDRARAQRAALLAHRDSALVVAGNRPTPEAYAATEQVLGVLVDAGLGPGAALRVLTALGSFVIGDALETQASAARPAESDGPPVAAHDYPISARAVREMGDDDDRFEEGLALFLAGLGARLAQAPGAAP